MFVCYVGDNIDIDSESRNITFERGIRTLGVNISINDDDIFEPLESVRFVLQALQEFRDIGVRIGFISEAIGNIIDDEGTCTFVRIVHNSLCQEKYFQYAYIRMSISFMVKYCSVNGINYDPISYKIYC